MEISLKIPLSSTYFVDKKRTFLDWQSDVIELRNRIISMPALTWLIYEEDAYQFSALFFALIAANKDVVLPQNGCPIQLQKAMESADAYAGSANLNADYTIKYAEGKTATSDKLILNGNSSVILFTSGSTGEPKAIAKKFNHLITEVEELNRTFELQLEACCFISTVSHQHIYGLLVKLLLPIWTGKDVLLQPFEYPEHIVHAIKRYRINSVCLVSSPAHFSRLVKDNVYSEIAKTFKLAISSGGPLLVETAGLMIKQLGFSPVEILGSTETGGIGWRQRIPECIELPWTAFDCVVLGEDENTQQLKIKSDYIATNDWFITEDRVELLSKKEFKLLGRSDRIVKIEEKRVSLDQVQASLKKQDVVEDAYCLTVLRDRGIQVAAVIVLSEMGRQFLQNNKKFKLNRVLQNALRNELEAIAMPKRFRYVDSLPYNTSGKLQKREMEKLFD